MATDKRVNLTKMVLSILEAPTRVSVPITIELDRDTEMQVECSWCGKDLGTKPGNGKTGTTSGICEGCYERVVGEPMEDVDCLSLD